MKAFSFLILLSVVAIYSSCAFQAEEADLILHNGTIHTLDATFSQAQAIAIKDGKVLEVGPERQILNKYKAKEKVDLAKKHVFPGFIDAHCHFLAYGYGQNQVDLRGTTSFSEVLSKLRDHKLPPGATWLKGRGWDQNDWEVKQFPTKTALDSLFPNTPVIIRRVDGHAALVNSKALELAQIKDSAKVEGGEFVKDENGLTGILIDNAISAMEGTIPQPTREEKIAALMSAQQECFAVGLTTVDDAGLMWDEVALIDSLHQSGDLKMRVYAMLSDHPDNMSRFLDSGPVKTDRLNVRSFKFYADGSLGSRGACMLKPYSDVPKEDHWGFLLNTPEHFREAAAQLSGAGFQMNTHCIGDSANRLILDIYAEQLKGINDSRWRIEHAQVIHPEDMPHFRSYTILPSVQPTHATSDMYWAEERLGRNRIKRAYPYQDLLKQSGLLALGTDFPVEQISPFLTLSAAIWRTDPSGYPEGGFTSAQCLSQEEALRGVTSWAAMANFEEKEKGMLASGLFADMIVLKIDLEQASQQEILNAEVFQTYVNGELVHGAKR